MNTGELIRKYRKKSNMTQDSLAKECGTSAAMIRQYELGKRNPKIETLQKISAALGIPYTILAPNTIIIDDTPIDCEINDILKKASNGELLTSGETALLRLHLQQSLQRVHEFTDDMTYTFAKSMNDSLPLTIESGRRVLEDSKALLLISYYDKLNSEGKTEAIKRISELTEIQKYATQKSED